METPAPRWARIGVTATLALPQLVIGAWAVTAPHSWYTSFPGVGPRLVAAEPPYNQHLASDAGAGFLAVGVALLVAAAWGNRAALATALLAYLAFTLPHAAYHALHPADALTGTEDALGTASLAGGSALALVFLWGAAAGGSTARSEAGAGRDVDSRARVAEHRAARQITGRST